MTPTVDSLNKKVVFSSDDTDFSIGVSEIKDSSGQISTDTTAKVLSTNTGSTLVEVTLDEEIIQNPDTAYPVSVTLTASSTPIGSIAPPDVDFTYFADTNYYSDGTTGNAEADFLILGEAGRYETDENGNSEYIAKWGTVFMKYDTSMLEGIDPRLIYDASLCLVEASGKRDAATVNLLRVTTDWYEDVVDPTIYYDVDTTYVGNNYITMQESGIQYSYEIDITQLFTDHMLYEQGYGGGVPNYGFQLRSPDANFGKHIYSSENWEIGYRPYISMRYEDPVPYPGYTTHDFINPDDPCDWYSFTPTETSIYDIYTTGTTDVYAFLYDSDLALITQDDDSGDLANFKISRELQANETYYLKVQGRGSATSGYYYLNIQHPDPFHHSNIDYVRIKKYDQSSWSGDSDITTIVTKSLKNQSAYFEVFAPDRSNISFLITQEVIDALNTRENNYLNYPTLHLASVYFHLAKNAVDEMVEANVIDSESPEYYGIWVYEANRLISTTQYVAEQIELVSAVVTIAYNVYRSVTNYYSTLSSSNNTTTVVSHNNYSSIVKHLDDIDDSIGSNVTSKKVLSAEGRNSILADTGYTNPPYKLGTPVVEFKHTSSTQYVRVYTEGITSPQGKWLMKYNDIAGLTPSQIQAKFALPNTPTHYVTVNVPSEIKMCSGFVGPNYGYTQNLGIQFELLQTIDDYLFINPTPIN